MASITLPLNYTPRWYQMPAWTALETGIKRALLIWHRRAGKDLFALNYCATQALERVGAYWHIFPTYKQGRKIAWEGKTKAGRGFLSHFPKEMIVRQRDQEMTLDFFNGSSYQIVGADNPDSQVGTNPVGMIFSEWAVMNDPSIWRFLQPILVENGGWAIFITTPRGRNHCYDMLQRIKNNPLWYSEVLPASVTKAVSAEAIEEARAEGMTADMIAQEFECSFDAALENAFYGEEMRLASEENRITQVPYEPSLQVETWWDLGMYDQTSIWWAQHSMGSKRLIDYEFASGQPLSYYAALLHKKREKWNCSYRVHLVPHDARVRSLNDGKTRVKTLKELGVGRIKVVKKHALQDGIQQVRQFLRTSYWDEQNCATGLEGLRQYRKSPVEGAMDPEGNQMFSSEPVHDWASHPADAYRTGAMGSRPDDSPGDQKRLYVPMSMA